MAPNKANLTELIKSAINRVKPKTSQETEALIQTILIKYESHLNGQGESKSKNIKDTEGK